MSNNNINEKTLSPIIIDKVTCCYLLHVLLVVQSERCSRIKKTCFTKSLQNILQNLSTSKYYLAQALITFLTGVFINQPCLSIVANDSTQRSCQTIFSCSFVCYLFSSVGVKEIFSKMLQCCLLNGGIFWVSGR